MVTLKQMEELLDTKLSKLENRIVKNLTNPTDIINPNTDKTKQVSNIVIDETNLVTPVRHSLPEKTFYDECTDITFLFSAQSGGVLCTQILQF